MQYKLKSKEHNLSEKEIIEKLETLLISSIKKEIPKKEKVALLFSGGLDSGIMALILKKLGYKFTCYTVEFYNYKFKKAEDVKYAKLLAKKLKLSFKIIKINTKEAEDAIPKVINIIKSNKPLLVSLALPMYFCLKKISDGKIKTVLYDPALDCIFAGFQKHKTSTDINQSCVNSLKNTYEIDFPKDQSIAKHFNLKLKAPFLNKELISFALPLSKEYKISKGLNKYILRKTALNLGLPESIALRKKKAIQYSSNFQKAIKKISKKHNFKKISDYLKSFNPSFLPS